jgi:glutaconate CoA-transferase, subunit A
MMATIYAAGFTHLIPFAAGHEIIRQGSKDLTLARATPDLIYDQMVAAGCARKVIFSYMGNPGSARCASCALRSSRAPGVGRILPLWHDLAPAGRRHRAALHADEPDRRRRPGKANPNTARVTDPYSGKPVVVSRPSNPDVAIVHVQRADADGNAHIWGIIGEQKEAAFAAEAGDPDR